MRKYGLPALIRSLASRFPCRATCTRIELVLHASLVVKLVMLLLTVVSLQSWYWIFRKAFAIREARARTDQFERDFWSGGDLNALYQSAVNNRHETGALERIFEAGYREFVKLRNQKTLDQATIVDGARRAMRATYQREIDDLEAHLSFLRRLSNMSTATLSAVAPGIAEALVATAIGLFAAIPAVVAYNRFAHDGDRIAVRFESFMEEFSNILQRQLR